MKTYLVEIETDTSRNIVEYCKTLKGAKRIARTLSKYNEKRFSILMMQGQYFGEGFHQYRLLLQNDKFYCIEVMSLSKKKIGKEY